MRRRLCSTTASPSTVWTDTTRAPLLLGCASISLLEIPAPRCAHVPRQRCRLLEICTTPKVRPLPTSSRQRSCSSEICSRCGPYLPANAESGTGWEGPAPSTLRARRGTGSAFRGTWESAARVGQVDHDSVRCSPAALATLAPDIVTAE